LALTALVAALSQWWQTMPPMHWPLR
jgi:hypothetical protein